MQTIEDIKTAVANAIESEKEKLLELGNWFWKNPEPGFREYKTSKRAIDSLKALGLPVQENLAITGFRAELDTGKPGPVFAILGELDSLIMPNHPECDPETGAAHACGHNGSITALIGVATGLVKANAAGALCGKILFIGTPAEEGIEQDFREDLVQAGKISCISGKPQLIFEGVFDDVGLAMMNHLSTKFGYHSHNGCINKKITFRGKSCHAASPEGGINALNAATLAQTAIGLLRESLGYSDKIRIHGIITNGGNAVNVIPDEVTMEYMLRAPTVEEIVSISDRFDRVVLHAAGAAECKAEIKTSYGSLPATESPEFGAVIRKIVEELCPGAAFDADNAFYKSCTDMCDIEAIMPAIHSYVPGTGGACHGNDFRITDPYTAYIVNAKVEALTAVELLYGNAEAGQRLIAGKKDRMPIPEYIKLVRSLNKTVSSGD